MISISINGKKIETKGNNITIINDDLIVDGKKLVSFSSANNEIIIEGDCHNIDTTGNVTVKGNCKDIDCNGNVICYGNIEGDIDCNGNVSLKRK